MPAHQTLVVGPHLPASWDKVTIRNVSLGELRMDVEMIRTGANLVVRATAAGAAVFLLVA